MPDFLLDDTDDDEATEEPRKDPFKELRAHAKRLEKELKAREAELEELKRFKAEQEARAFREQVARTFEQLGLPGNYAELYPEGREATQEAVSEFARKYGWLKEEPTAPVQSGGFQPVSLGGVSPVNARLTYEQYEELLRTDPAEAIRAVAENRVDGLLRHTEVGKGV